MTSGTAARSSASSRERELAHAVLRQLCAQMPDGPDRLLAEQVALVVATREPGGEFRGQPELPVGGWLTVTPELLARFIAEAGGEPTGIAALLQARSRSHPSAAAALRRCC